MTAAPLDYRSPHAVRPAPRWPWRLFLATAALLMAAMVVPGIEVRRVESRIDAVTGSVTWKTIWLFGITSGPRVDVSPLERRLRQSGIPWTQSWAFLHNTHRNVFGRATCYECGTAPPIYYLRPALGDFAAASTDAELRQFVRVMESGSEAEQKAAVDAAVERTFAAPEDSACQVATAPSTRSKPARAPHAVIPPARRGTAQRGTSAAPPRIPCFAKEIRGGAGTSDSPSLPRRAR